MQELTYYKDPYLKSIECSVLSVDKNDKETRIVTDKTIFYPECGGQPGDRGKLGEFVVLDTRKDGDTSVLILDKDANVVEGQSYTLSLDWEHRYKYMVMHLCQHMLSGLLFTQFGIGTVAIHQGDDYLTIEIDKENVDKSTIEELITIANKKIAEGHRVSYHEVSHKEAEDMNLRRSIKVDTDVRLVEIEGIDIIACGGVHASSTSEIQLVLFSGHEQIRGHERLYFRCGKDALEEVRNNQKIIKDIRDRFTCSDDEIISKIDSISQELYQTKQSLKAAQEKLAVLEINQHIVNNIATFETDLELASISSCVKDFENLALCALRKQEGKTQWLIVTKGKFEKLDFNTLRQKILDPNNAKGGGKAPVYQGIIPHTEQDKIQNFLKAFSDEANIYRLI